MVTELAELSQFVRFLSDVELSVHSHYTHQSSKKSKLLVVVKFVVQNLTTSVAYQLKLLVSKSVDNFNFLKQLPQLQPRCPKNLVLGHLFFMKYFNFMVKLTVNCMFKLALANTRG